MGEAPGATHEEEVRVEATGETVGEAKWQALRQLRALAPGLDRGSVRFQVVSEGERGLLGVGYAPARVVALAPAPAPARRPAAESEPAPVPEELAGDESPLGALARELVERVTGALGVDCRVRVAKSGDQLVVSCSGPDLGLLIGRHGQTIDAVQFLANAVVRRRHPDDAKEIVVDAVGYRSRREAALHSLADASAERALERDGRVELEPMTSVERKVVHLRLKDHPGVETTSEGTEPNRYVVVMPAEGGA